MQAYSKNYYTKNKDKWVESSKRGRIKQPRRSWARLTLARHRANGFTVDLTTDELMEYIKEKTSCEICEVELDFKPLKGKSYPNSPSLDRKHNEKIVTKDNIQLLCRNCNHRKGDMPMQDYIDFCKMVADKFIKDSNTIDLEEAS